MERRGLETIKIKTICSNKGVGVRARGLDRTTIDPLHGLEVK